MNKTMETIALKGVQITALAHRLKEGILLHRLSVSGLLTRELATDLGCQDLVFLENGALKHGFTKFDLDVECGAFRASFEADPDLKQGFELTGDSCESFVVKRTETGSFLLSWRMNYHGDPHPALAYLEAVGEIQRSRLFLSSSNSCSQMLRQAIYQTKKLPRGCRSCSSLLAATRKAWQMADCNCCLNGYESEANWNVSTALR